METHLVNYKERDRNWLRPHSAEPAEAEAVDTLSWWQHHNVSRDPVTNYVFCNMMKITFVMVITANHVVNLLLHLLWFISQQNNSMILNVQTFCDLFVMPRSSAMADIRELHCSTQVISQNFSLRTFSDTLGRSCSQRRCDGRMKWAANDNENSASGQVLLEFTTISFVATNTYGQKAQHIHDQEVSFQAVFISRLFALTLCSFRIVFSQSSTL